MSSNSIHYWQKFVITQIFFRRWMIQQTLMYLHNAILLGKYRKNYWYMNNMAISHRCYAEWKKPASKSYTKVPLIWYCRKGKASEYEDEWLLGLRGGWRGTTIWGISGGKGDRTILHYDGGCLLDSICLLKLRLFSHYRVWLNCDRLDCNHQALLSKGFARQKYLSGLPFPFPGNLPDPGIKPTSPALQVNSLPLSHLGSPKLIALYTKSGYVYSLWIKQQRALF